MNIGKTCVLYTLALHWLAVTASAQIVISEIHYHPVEVPAFNADGTPFLALTNDVHEFVEIQNAGARTVDLSGWTLAGGIGFTFPTNTTLASGAFRVIAKNPARLAVVYLLSVTNVLGPYGGYLGNNSDTVRLRDAAGNVIDAVAYDSRFPWAQSADALGAQDRFTGLSSTNYQYKGRSLQRVSVTWPSSDPANWLASPLSGPTPGGPQAVTRTIPKPVVVAFSAVQTSDGATIVRSNNPVTVNCTYSATNRLSNVTLEYFVDNVNSTTETRISVAMTDLGGGKYAASIPAQANRSIVRYRFKADRGDGLEVVSPRADDPQIAPIGPGGAREAWHGYFVTPVRTSANAIYDVLVSTTSLSQMSANITQSPKRVTMYGANGLPRDIPYVAATAPQWDGTQPAVFACNGELWDIQIRYHGSIFHRSPGTPSYKVHFSDHHPFNGQTSWFETMHSTEFIEAQKLNRLIGLPASKMRRVDWYFNTGTQVTHSEQGEYAGEMLDAYHELQQQLNPGSPKEETGELYKDVGNRDPSQNNNEGPYTRGDIAPMLANSRWSQLERYQWTFSLQDHQWKGSKPIRDLLEGMWTARGDTPATHNFASNSVSLARARAWFTNNWDIDTTLTSMALLEWMAIWDDAAQNQFFWRRADGRWSRLGWDYDGVMAGGASMGSGSSQTIYGGEQGAPNVFDGVNWWKDTFYKCFRAEYNQRLWELNNSFLDPTNLTALGCSLASTFARSRMPYVNTQLASLGTYYKPTRPANAYPPNGAAVVGMTNLATTPYSHPRLAAHYATKWEIRAAAGDYETPILRVTSTNSLTAFPIPFDQLTYGQTYYWRATHIDTNGHPSIVSAETSFSWGKASITAGALVLNEILASNRRAVQSGNEFPDYIELRNNGVNDMPLDGYTLTDDPLNPAKYAFPPDTTITAGNCLLVWCDSDTNAPGLHSGFKLKEEGETVLLMFGPTIVDSVSFGPQAPDISLGRIANGTGGWQANTPTPGTANTACVLGSINNLRINEWMAEPAYGEDWFELYNTDTNVVALAGLYLSDTPATPMIARVPALSFIAGRGYMRFWADGNADGNNHCNFKLSKSGENIVLTAANGVTTIDTVTFSTQAKDVSQGRLPDGGPTIVSFSAQTASPGHGNWAPAPVYVNEVLANAVPPLEDAVELYNPTADAVDIGNWWLSDDVFTPKKFQIPAGTLVPANGYLVFYDDALKSGTVPFSIRALGDELLLSAVDSAGALTGYGSLVRFGPSAENTPFGRIPAAGLKATSGGAEFWPLNSTTFGQDNPPDVATFRTGGGAANATPQIGPIIINEIMYRPPDLAGSIDNTTNEYIEIYNLSGSAVDLSGWCVKGDVDFTFPPGTSLASAAYALLVSFDLTNTAALTAFCATYRLTDATAIYGPYSPNLANSTSDIELACPVMINGSASAINVDKVEYRDLAPWDASADGGGMSLQRTSSFIIGNDAANWRGAAPTPGALNAGVVTNAVWITTAPLLPGGVVGRSRVSTFAAFGGMPPYSWTLTSGSVPGLTLATNGTLSGTPTLAGTNYITVQVVDTGGATASGDFTLIVAISEPAIATTSPLPDGMRDAAYAQTFTASGGTAPYLWKLAGGSLPGGLVLNGAGVLAGTPTNYGTFHFTVQVADSGGLVVSEPCALWVAVPPLVITALSPMVSGRQGEAYSQALTGAGGVTPYSWSIESGSLPPGLTLSGMGDITGTPTAPGTYTFTARLSDRLGSSITKTLVLTVVPPPLVIATGALDDSTFGAAYQQTLAATGGWPPYTWSIVWGGLPDGLSLSPSGVVSGTPTNVATFSFIARATDDSGAYDEQMFTVSIRNNPPLVTAQPGDNGIFQLLVSGDPGTSYTIEGSTNLVYWETVFTTNAPAMPFTWSDPGAASCPARFFRVLLGP